MQGLHIRTIGICSSGTFSSPHGEDFHINVLFIRFEEQNVLFCWIRVAFQYEVRVSEMHPEYDSSIVIVEPIDAIAEC